MVDSRHEQLRELFDRVIDLSLAEHEAFLARECAGDAKLRQRLAAMLDAALDERFLSTRAVLPPGLLPNAELAPEPGLFEGPGTRNGPYKLLQLIGEGGFGAVFMAEQEKPVARKVALKIIKLGMHTRNSVAPRMPTRS
ncbi:MAG: hypothetical protein ABIP94_23205 [Planctomycetota bacterium]